MDIFNGTAFGGFIGDKPNLIHLETHTFKLKLKNADGSAFDLSGYETAECAVGNTFDHVYNELMAYAFGDACQITDAAAGEITFTLDCNTVKFGDVVRFNAQMAYMEINLFDTSANMTRVLLDRVECRPHVRDQEGAPVSGDPQYYNKAEVDALISSATGAVESVNGKTGAVVLDASDVGAMPLDGMPFEPLTSAASVSITAGGKAYTLEVDQTMTLAFPSPGDATCYFWLYLTTGSTAYAVTFDDAITWDTDSGPDLSATNSLFRLAFLWDVPSQKWLGSQFWKPEALT